MDNLWDKDLSQNSDIEHTEEMEMVHDSSEQNIKKLHYWHIIYLIINHCGTEYSPFVYVGVVDRLYTPILWKCSKSNELF